MRPKRRGTPLRCPRAAPPAHTLRPRRISDRLQGRGHRRSPWPACPPATGMGTSPPDRSPHAGPPSRPRPSAPPALGRALEDLAQLIQRSGLPLHGSLHEIELARQPIDGALLSLELLHSLRRKLPLRVNVVLVQRLEERIARRRGPPSEAGLRLTQLRLLEFQLSLRHVQRRPRRPSLRSWEARREEVIRRGPHRTSSLDQPDRLSPLCHEPSRGSPAGRRPRLPQARLAGAGCPSQLRSGRALPALALSRSITRRTQLRCVANHVLRDPTRGPQGLSTCLAPPTSDASDQEQNDPNDPDASYGVHHRPLQRTHRPPGVRGRGCGSSRPLEATGLTRVGASGESKDPRSP